MIWKTFWALEKTHRKDGSKIGSLELKNAPKTQSTPSKSAWQPPVTGMAWLLQYQATKASQDAKATWPGSKDGLGEFHGCTPKLFPKLPKSSKSNPIAMKLGTKLHKEVRKISIESFNPSHLSKWWELTKPFSGLWFSQQPAKSPNLMRMRDLLKPSCRCILMGS